MRYYETKCTYVAFLSKITSTPKIINNEWVWVDNGNYPGNHHKPIQDHIDWKKYLVDPERINEDNSTKRFVWQNWIRLGKR